MKCFVVVPLFSWIYLFKPVQSIISDNSRVITRCEILQIVSLLRILRKHLLTRLLLFPHHLLSIVALAKRLTLSIALLCPTISTYRVPASLYHLPLFFLFWDCKRSSFLFSFHFSFSKIAVLSLSDVHMHCSLFACTTSAWVVPLASTCSFLKGISQE